MSATPKSRDEVAAAYASPTWWYDVRGFFILTFAYRSTLPQQLRLFGGNLSARHLEIAIGSGTLFELILRWRRLHRLPRVQVTGVDYAESMLAGARKRFAGDASIQLMHADAAALPFEDATFDSANIANAVHCLPDVDAALRETFRVLKPGGTLAANVLLFPSGPAPLRTIAQRLNDWGMRKGILVTPYRAEDVRRRLTSAGFVIRTERIRGNTLDVLAAKA
jgi:ubiquinone/menaquinone biosynthesis C-methylase UbiE